MLRDDSFLGLIQYLPFQILSYSVYLVELEHPENPPIALPDVLKPNFFLMNFSEMQLYICKIKPIWTIFELDTNFSMSFDDGLSRYSWLMLSSHSMPIRYIEISCSISDCVDQYVAPHA